MTDLALQASVASATDEPQKTSTTATKTTPSARQILFPLPSFQPDLHARAWVSVPHPTLPLLATAHGKSVTVFSLVTLSAHSALTGGHSRSVRSVAWEPGLPPSKLCLATGSFDASVGLWRWDGGASALETPVDSEPPEWEFTLVLEGHESEVKGCAFTPSGAYLATCSRDKSVWIWEDIDASADADDVEYETVAVLNDHDGDVKAVAWCPDVPGRNARRSYSADVLASASYDNNVRVWREDSDGEWVCVAVLVGHEGTVWGVQWEPRPAENRFPRLLSLSADATLRVWTLEEDHAADEVGAAGAAGRGPLGGVPNTVRSLSERWTCTAVLPQAHRRDVYAATWSADSGLVASTGSDGIIAVYRELEEAAASPPPSQPADSAASGAGAPRGLTDGNAPPTPPMTSWQLLSTIPSAHGPYEVNHITWCRRYDASCKRRGEEEMLVTTGDEGLVRCWEVRLEDPMHEATSGAGVQ